VNKNNTNPDPSKNLRTGLQFPDKLIEDIKNLHKQTAQIPPEVDRTIINRAHEHFAQKEFNKTKKRRFRLVHLWKVAAAAAVIILAFSLDLTHKSEQQFSLSSISYEDQDTDIDRNGRVDILDAFTLAKQIESDRYNEAECDINGDGMVDNKDIDAVALAAVRLDKGVL
jgi:hypothetical protein